VAVVGASVRVPFREIVFRFVRSSGPGGQNVNRVASKAVMRWNVRASPSIAEDVRARFVARFASRITAEGDLLLAGDRHRERERNREDCLERLSRMLASVAASPRPRRKTRAPRNVGDVSSKECAPRQRERRRAVDVGGENGSFGPVERGEMSIVRGSDETIVIRLAGAWELATGLPSADPVQRELASGRARAVAFDTRDLRAWDSAVVTFLARVTEVCRERGIPLDRKGLPEGMQRRFGSPPFGRTGGAAARTGAAGLNASALPRHAARPIASPRSERSPCRRLAW
jgi:ribosome-associated protein